MKNFDKICIDNTQNDCSIEPADSKDSKFAGTLAVDVAQSISVPETSGDRLYPFSRPGFNAVFKAEPGKVIWYSVNEAPVLPTGTLGTSNVEMVMSGEIRAFYAGDTIYFITHATTADIAIAFYAI